MEIADTTNNEWAKKAWLSYKDSCYYDFNFKRLYPKADPLMVKAIDYLGKQLK